MLSNESLLHASGAELIFSPTEFTFLQLSALFRQVGSLFRQVGSLIRQSLRSRLSCNHISSRPTERTDSSVQLNCCFAMLS